MNTAFNTIIAANHAERRDLFLGASFQTKHLNHTSYLYCSCGILHILFATFTF